jgi:hypothetical protein
MVGGPRGAALALPPGGAAHVEVTLVPYHTGLMALPSVHFSLGSGGALAATDGCAVFVRRGAGGDGGGEAATSAP